MAEATQFDHDRLSHLLADHLLEVPRFQRSYSWDSGNVDEYLEDLATARERPGSYFMGTVVFAESPTPGGRRQIVDGQQRLATTAILLVAARDLLEQYGKKPQSRHIDESFLKGYDLKSEDNVERLILGASDQITYNALLEGELSKVDGKSLIGGCYQQCLSHLRKIAPSTAEYRKLIEVSTQLESNVEVLVAVASDLAEAYVIFETLNDRGADLTTADLLKNFLFSQAKHSFAYIEAGWIKVEGAFDKPEELVKFIRYEYASRHGRVSTRKLYRSIQQDIGSGSTNAKKYMERLTRALDIYLALKDSDHQRWNTIDFDVRDALLAYRRFGFESSMPLLIAAFQTWTPSKAAKLLVKVAGWSVRGQFAGRIGASLSEEAFGDAAKAISEKSAMNQTSVRKILSKLIPNDTEFRQAFEAYGTMPVARAKYLLGMLEKAEENKQDGTNKALPDWSSRGVTIEHILAQSVGKTDEKLSTVVGLLGNLALLEKSLNRDLGDKDFPDKTDAYAKSAFQLTKHLSNSTEWVPKSIEDRTAELSTLACAAWPV
jgi:Protein of unknown function DUF262/Protein of unknown function (DUF1524)